uniref:alpha/beta hydrolase fold domain-containing protein n=1 Tax=Clavibacter michiganensis TaxID=28447 RepID=UPI002930F794
RGIRNVQPPVPLHSARGMQWYWGLYVPDATRRVPVDAAPLRAAVLGGSAPAVIVAAAVDPLSDEAEEYADRLAASGVPVEFVRREGVPHLFLVFPSTPARDEVLAQVAPAVRAAFA